MAEKLLIIHAGGPKAGSSALQNFLDLNSNKLSVYGFDYRNKVNIFNSYEIQSGNGVSLTNSVCAEHTTDAKLDAMVLSYFRVNACAICSSEAFSSFSVRNWAALHESAVRTGVQLRVVYYVRNVIPFLVSSYDQLIKRHGESRPFARWSMDAQWQHSSALRAISQIFPREMISVLHYDRVQRNIVPSFLDLLSSYCKLSINLHEEPRIINRSLTGDGRKALLAINTEFGSRYSKELSDLLIYSRPTALPEPVACALELEAPLLDRFQGEVDWVNEEFFAGSPTISVLPQVKAVIPDAPNRELEKLAPLQNSTDKLLIDWLIRKLKSQESETQNLVLERLAGSCRNRSGCATAGVPADFNPIEYLVLNPDVLFSGVDPTQHFIEAGMLEGRIHKIL